MGKYPLEPMALQRATKSRGKGTQRTERPAIVEHRPSNGVPAQRWSRTQFMGKVKLLSSLALAARDLKSSFPGPVFKKLLPCLAAPSLSCGVRISDLCCSLRDLVS